MERVARLLVRPCWVPDRLYDWLPLFCLLAGAAALLLPVGVLTVLCILYLFCYGALVLYVRAVWGMLGRYKEWM